MSKLALSSAAYKLGVLTKGSKPDFSLVIPAYNEEDKVQSTIEKVDYVVRKSGLKYEIIVVNDGSIDGTQGRAIICANNNSHVRVIGYRKNMGKGHAIKSGFAHSRGDIVVFIDGDLDIEPKQIIRYIKALKHGDIVIGSKWHQQSNVEMPLIRRVFSRIFSLLVKLLMGIRFSDTQTGLKAVRRKPLEKIFSKLTVKRYAFDVELLVMANLNDLRVVELPVTLVMRRALFSLREVWRMFLDLLSISYRLRILKHYRSK